MTQSVIVRNNVQRFNSIKNLLTSELFELQAEEFIDGNNHELVFTYSEYSILGKLFETKWNKIKILYDVYEDVEFI